MSKRALNMDVISSGIVSDSEEDLPQKKRSRKIEDEEVPEVEAKPLNRNVMKIKMISTDDAQ